MADEEKKVIYKVEIDEKAADAEVKKLVVTLDSLTKSNKDLRAERAKVDIQSKEGQKELVRLNGLIDANNKLIKENVSSLEKQKIGIGSYKESIIGASKEINIAGTSVGGLTDKLASFANPATAAVGIVGLLGAAYARSSIGAKDLEFAQNELGFATTILTDKFARLVSSAEDGEGFFTGMLDSILYAIDPTTAILANLAALANEKIDDIREKSGLVQIEINERLSENLELQTAIANTSEEDGLSTEQKQADILKIQENIRINQEARKKLIEEEISAQISLRNVTGDQQHINTEINKLKGESSRIDKDATKALEKTEKQLNAILNAQEKINNAKAGADRRSKRVDLKDEDSDPLEAIKKFSEDRANILLNTGNTILVGEEQFAAASLSIQKTLDKSKKDSSKLATEIIDQQLSEEQILHQRRANTANKAVSDIGNIFGKQSLAFKIAASAQALIQTYLSATESFASLAGIPIVGPALGAIAAGIAVASGLANVARINSVKVSQAAGGGNFLTKGPTMLLVGDNPGGVERVTVEPLSGKGQTKVRGNGLIQMAGGGSLTTQPSAPFQTSFIAGQINTERLMNGMINSIRNIPRVAVVIEDINLLNDQRAEITESARLR